ncbi:hypothetical protein AAU61_05515 [Desulfocarbo indianensis]|nr:hypothetical protein AAU61_05515 [Desulfocarbo indianensis]
MCADLIKDQIDHNLDKLENECRRSPLFAWSNGLTELDYTPPILYISPTNACSHSCRICAHKTAMRRGVRDDGERQRGLMDWDRFTAIADQVPEDVTRIYFYKHGEPLLHPRYLEMLQYLRSKVGTRVEIALSTNATHLKEGMFPVLLDNLNVILFSIYGLDRQTFKELHGRDDFEPIMAKIKKFHEFYLGYDKPKSEVYFNFVRQEGNADVSDEEVESFFVENFPAFHNAIHGVYNFGGRISEGNYQVLDEADKSFYPVCIFPFVVTTVLWDGFISHCMVDVEELVHNGRVPEENLKELVNHPGLIDYRRASLEGDFQTLAQRRLGCGECNWLFHLRAQGLNYFTLRTKQIAKSFELSGLDDLKLSGEEYLYSGLLNYLRGELDQALGNFVAAQEIITAPEIRSKAVEWEAFVRAVYRRRRHLERWERAFNEEGLSIRSIFKTTYFETTYDGRQKRIDKHSF